MKKTKHTEEKIIGAVKQLEAGRPGRGDGGDRPDSVQLEGEVRRDGSQRCEEAEGAGGREPAAEGDGCRSQPRQGCADHGHTKKRLNK
jgi:hypothetical protein